MAHEHLSDFEAIRQNSIYEIWPQREPKLTYVGFTFSKQKFDTHLHIVLGERAPTPSLKFDGIFDCEPMLLQSKVVTFMSQAVN